MDTSASPTLRQTPSGWLALSDDGDRFHIGVPGATAEEAESNFRERRAFWDALSRRPDPHPEFESA